MFILFDKKQIILSLSLVALCGLFFLNISNAAKASLPDLGLPAHQANQVLIKLKNSDKIYQLNTNYRSVAEFIAEHQRNDSIEYLEPNYLYRSVLDPNDTFYPQQLAYLSAIKAPQAWNYTTGDSSVVVAVVDTGVNINHPDLINNIWHNAKEIPGNWLDDDGNGYVDDYSGWDFVLQSPDPSPKFNGNYNFLGINHGTIIAGVIAAEGNNKIGITGLNWRAKIMSLRVLDGEGAGNTLDVAKAIDYARLNGAQVINLSFVGEGESQTLKTAIAKAYQAGIVIVAAAGNEVNQGVDMTYKPQYPVCHDGDTPGDNWVIGVGSIDNNDQLASFSNYGKCIDLVAPGVSIFSTLYKEPNHPQYDKEYGGLWSGTSISAPQVAATAALLKALKPELNILEIRDHLFNGADSVDAQNPNYLGKLGHGKLNVLATLTAAKNSLSQLEIRTDKLITAPGPSGGPQIKTYFEGQQYSQFFALDKTHRLGINIASRDLNGDNQEELLVSAEKGDEPWVYIFDIKGTYKTKFLAYDKNMKFGVRVGIADVNNDGQKEIITVPGAGYQPLIRIFNQTGKQLSEFLAFNSFFKGGLSIAVGDVNNDKFEEIIIGPGPGTQAYVKVFNHYGQLISQFLAYDKFYGGINVTLGRYDDSGLSYGVAPMGQSSPQVKIFNSLGLFKKQFLAYDKKFIGGVNLASGDINGDGLDELITGAGSGGGPHVRIFRNDGSLLGQFMAYDPKFRGGVRVSAGK
ncbi:MAG TPA: S8 family peptidase [bacterium]|nr:S8 family peptidase [bacterium]